MQEVNVHSLIECVVETGRHQYVASSSHVPATATEHNMPYLVRWRGEGVEG